MYEIEGDSVPTPSLPGEAIVAFDADEAVDRLSGDLVQHAFNCVRKFGDFHLALSGAPAFELLYRRLMYDPNYRWLPWRRTHVWFTEEFGEDSSGGAHERLVRDIIGEHADVPDEQFHPIPMRVPSPAAAYEQRIREVLEWRERGQDRLDYVLLTIDAEGHSGGLFPGSAALDETDRWFHLMPTDAGDRVVMTPACLNTARFIAVMAVGAETAEAVARIAGGDDPPPITRLAPAGGELRWYLDVAVCGA